jgi:hypothetical protein
MKRASIVMERVGLSQSDLRTTLASQKVQAAGTSVSDVDAITTLFGLNVACL